MKALGKIVLAYVRAFHYWHEHHLQVSLALLIAAGIALAAGSLALLKEAVVEVPTEIEHVVGIPLRKFKQR